MLIQVKGILLKNSVLFVIVWHPVSSYNAEQAHYTAFYAITVLVSRDSKEAHHFNVCVCVFWRGGACTPLQGLACNV